jgi:hypothetical protein
MLPCRRATQISTDDDGDDELVVDMLGDMEGLVVVDTVCDPVIDGVIVVLTLSDAVTDVVAVADVV